MEENGPFHPSLNTVAEMIELLWDHIDKLKKQNEYLDFIKKEGDIMFPDDTCWHEKDRKIIQRIIDANTETIIFFDKTARQLEDWSIMVDRRNQPF